MILPVLILIIWLFALWLFTKNNMFFYRFIIGSVGAFGLLMYTAQKTFQVMLQYVLTFITGMLGDFFKLFVTYPEYSMITVYYKNEAISFFVDYECSGVIEIFVFICLLLFYPIYTTKEKIKLSLIGVLYIFVSNVLRIFFICTILKLFGPKILFFTHTIFARLLFFFMMITLYYYVFTRPHILRQKIGNLSYGK